MDSETTTPIHEQDRDKIHAQLAIHEKALAMIATERAQLQKRLESLKLEHQTLEAVARKLAARRSNIGDK
jgi:septal ring factor EnvC (AmiA/AmiB activator)